MGFYVPTIRCQFVWFGSHNRGSHQGRKGALWLPSPRLVAFPKRTNTVFAILTYCRVLFKGHFLAQRKSRHCIEQIVNQPQNKKAHEQKSYSDVAALRFDHPLQWKLVRPGNFLEFSINYVTMQAFTDVMVTCEDAMCLTVLRPLPWVTTGSTRETMGESQVAKTHSTCSHQDVTVTLASQPCNLDPEPGRNTNPFPDPLPQMHFWQNKSAQWTFHLSQAESQLTLLPRSFHLEQCILFPSLPPSEFSLTFLSRLH